MPPGEGPADLPMADLPGNDGPAADPLAETVINPQSWTPSFTTSTVLNADGTSSTHYPDGTQDVRAPDGSCWRLAPTGEVIHAWQEPPAPQWRPPHPIAADQPDGTTVVYHPDGSKELWHGGVLATRFDPSGRPIP